MKRNSNTVGVTIVELLVVISVSAILIIIAVPSFISFMQSNRIKILAQNLYYNLQYARGEAIKRNAKVYVTFTTGSSWCYGINPTSACNCATPSSCTLGATTAGNTQATLTATNLSSNSIIFEPNHGAANVAPTITYTTTGGTSEVSVEVGLSGNAQTCSTNMSGFQAC